VGFVRSERENEGDIEDDGLSLLEVIAREDKPRQGKDEVWCWRGVCVYVDNAVCLPRAYMAQDTLPICTQGVCDE
jgi:hypothetical protein